MSTPLSILGTIWGVMMGIASRWEKRTDHEEKTILAVSKAFHATQKYYAYLKKKKLKRDAERESDLSLAWEEAAILLRRYNQDLSARLDIKSGYWRDPTRWTDSEADDARIGLDRVKKEADRLLKFRRDTR